MSVSRAFADPNMVPADFSSFSKQEIDADTAVKALEQLEPIPAVRSTNPMDLGAILSANAIQAIQSGGKITFHTVGDTGGVHSPQFQFAVAAAMAEDQANDVSFWYHLGDVVYYCGQEQYYYEQFFDPYRNYNAPILAIPGNHDAVIFQGESTKSLAAFLTNFCASQPGRNPDSQGAVRTTMDQPGVYFTFNAPFVKFIGLYSNTSEGATEGVIAGATVGNAQLDFLQQQLAAAKSERAGGQGRALVIATHHPPFTASPDHIPSPTMLQQIDQTCTAVGIQPDLYLSGHSHQYERYTRTIAGKQIPYVVAGMGGYYNLPGLKTGNKYVPPKTPVSGTDASGNPLTLEVYNDTTFGFMRMTVSSASITGQFVTVDTASGKTGVGDSFSVDLKAGTVAKGLAAAKRASKSSASSRRKPRT
jgi:hypothetical protein